MTSGETLTSRQCVCGAFVVEQVVQIAGPRDIDQSKKWCNGNFLR